jgi:hypothetical protein
MGLNLSKFVTGAVVLATCMSGVDSRTTYKVLVGRTGVGKSYILRLFGCDTKSCPGSESCTHHTILCDDQGQHTIDSVGLDDDGKSYKIMFEGNEITMSGLTYPLYDLFETLEMNGIHEVEFFNVHALPVVRNGNTGNKFLDFVHNDLGCSSVTRVLNHYDERDPGHRAEFHPGDITVPRNPTSPPELVGNMCQFALAPNWRKKLLDSDLAAVKSRIDVANCDAMKARKEEFEKILEMKPQGAITTDCSYEYVSGVTGGHHSGGASSTAPNAQVNFHSEGSLGTISGSISAGGGGSSGGMYGNEDRIVTVEKRVNEDCAANRKEQNDAIMRANEQLHEERMEYLWRISELDEGLLKCRKLSNWKG